MRCGKQLSVISAVIGWINQNSLSLAQICLTLLCAECIELLLRGCINELPCNGGIAKTKGGRQNGGALQCPCRSCPSLLVQ
jgi:hypothetical protein